MDEEAARAIAAAIDVTGCHASTAARTPENAPPQSGEGRRLCSQ
jgi:hypothetical protein